MKYYILVILSMFIISGCGGGSSTQLQGEQNSSGVNTPPPATNTPPTVDAGANQTITEGESVTLKANASDKDGNITSYEWKEGQTTIGTDAQVVLTNLSKGAHTFTVTVTDNKGATASDSVIVEVKAKNTPPATNTPPTVDAGANQTITEGESVTLKANASDKDGNITSYEWKEGQTTIGTDAQVVLTNLSKGAHTFTVTVTDNKGATASDSVIVIVKAKMSVSAMVGFLDNEHGIEPWAVNTDNSVAKLAKDINKRGASSNPSHLIAVKNWLYFVADDGVHGEKLWMNDGISENSIMVDDGIPVNAKQRIENIVVLGNKVFYVVVIDLGNGIYRHKIYMSDIGSDTATEIDTGIEPLIFNQKLLYLSGYSIKIYDPIGDTKKVLIEERYAIYKLIGYIDNTLFFTKDKWDSKTSHSYRTLYMRKNNKNSIIKEDIYKAKIVNDKVFFISKDQKELWCYNKTEDKTTKLHTFSKKIGKDRYSKLAAYRNKLYFIGNDDVNGDALWVSDGTPEGTYFLKDINIYNLGASLKTPYVAYDKLYFVSGREPWVTDGTKDGTILLELRDGIFGSYPEYFTAYKNKVYFKANNGNSDNLYVTDGTKDGTKQITTYTNKDEFSISDLMVFKNSLFFRGSSKQDGKELWKSDGTKEETKLFSNINTTTKASISSKTKFIKMGKYYYFSANDGNGHRGHNSALWRTDGTNAGTTIVKNGKSYQGLGPNNLTLIDNKLFFSGCTSTPWDVELWVSDGTEAGTHMVKDIMPNDEYYHSGSLPKMLINAGGTLVFVAKDKVHGYQIWKSDGTEDGTVMLSNFAKKDFISPSLNRLVYLNGAIYFKGNGSNTGEEFYKLDITTGKTSLVKKGLSRIEEMSKMGNKIYFKANSDDVSTKEIWVSDGTDKGTKLLKKIQSGPANNTIHNLTVVKDKLYFLANDGSHGAELWVSDGTADGTHMAKDITPGDYRSHTLIEQMTSLGDKLYFTAYDNEHGRELWVSDGSESGTHLVKDIMPGIIKSAVKIYHGVNGKLLFSAYDENGNHLWITDGTQEGTKIIEPSK